MCGGGYAVSRGITANLEAENSKPPAVATTSIKDGAEVPAPSPTSQSSGDPTNNLAGVGSGGGKGGRRMTRGSSGTTASSGRRRASAGLGL